MKTRAIIFIVSLLWTGLNAQQISVNIEKSAGECLLEGNCEINTICYDLTLQIDEPNWELRSYNIWVEYPSPPLLSYNSDNSCATQNGGDTDNNSFGQYRVAGVNGTFILEPGVDNPIHSICFEYSNGNLLKDSSIGVGGTALVFGFPFETTVTLKNTNTGESQGFVISSKNFVEIEIDNKHSLNVESGWSGISTYMEPDQTDIEFLMSPAIGNLVLMYNLTEGIFSPEHNINTIVNWNYKSGYIMKVTDGVTLNICGAEPQNKTINLMAGWNVIPVLNNENVPVTQVFDDIGDNLVIVKQIAGYQMYYPAFGVYSLNNLEPGYAYFVKVLESCQITFPAEMDKQASNNQTYYFEEISPWSPINKTPESHVFCFDADASNKLITGDLIGAFDQSGRCTGIMEVLDEKEAFAVSVFGDDETTEIKDGMSESELVAFTLFRAATGEVFNLDVQYRDDSPNEGNFVFNGISIVKNILISTTATEYHNYLSGVDLQIFPNPTDGETNFKLSGDVLIDGTLVLTDSRGQMIYQTEHLHDGGVSFREFDFSNYSPGVYYLRLFSENYLNIQKIVVK